MCVYVYIFNHLFMYSCINLLTYLLIYLCTYVKKKKELYHHIRTRTIVKEIHIHMCIYIYMHLLGILKQAKYNSSLVTSLVV